MFCFCSSFSNADLLGALRHTDEMIFITPTRTPQRDALMMSAPVATLSAIFVERLNEPIRWKKTRSR